jgi:hypothetical protein
MWNGHPAGSERWCRRNGYGNARIPPLDPPQEGSGDKLPPH